MSEEVKELIFRLLKSSNDLTQDEQCKVLLALGYQEIE